MRALAQQGKRNAALAHYDEYCALLEQELGVEPSVEIEAVYDAVREREGALGATPAVHAEPEARKQRRLPSPATPFVGRRREMAEIMGMLEDGCRLVTLLGPGGSGKTRLSIEVAKQLAGRYAHGGAFVELAPLSDPAAIPTAIATALDFRFAGEGSPREQVLHYLANKEMLLVLDNVEHLLDGVGLVEDVLQTASGLELLATSRARLQLRGECIHELSGMTIPIDETHVVFEEVEGVELFLTHARRVEPDFELAGEDKAAVARICRLVEGMPLAIELAASWVRYLPPGEIADELATDLDFLADEYQDLPERQRSMRATFDHSWNLLDEEQREALMKLSVFRGGASRRAARAVTGVSLHTLAGLADNSLLSRDPNTGRFAMHELVRQYATERLEEKGEAEAVRNAHSDYYLAVLADRLPDLKGRDQLGALGAIERDFENVRVAWRWAAQQEQWQHFSEASQSLYHFTTYRNRRLDGIDLFDTALHALPAPASREEKLARAYVLASRCGLLGWLGPPQEALAAVPDLHREIERLDDPAAVAYCQMMLMMLYYTVEGEAPAEAAAALEEARAYFREVGDDSRRAAVLTLLGVVRARAGQPEESLELTRRGLSLAREAGNLFVAAMLLHNVGAATLELEGPTEDAVNYLEEAIELLREIGESYAANLALLSSIFLSRDGDLKKSRPMLEEALTIAAEHNDPRVYAYTLVQFATHRLLEGQYDSVLALTEEALAMEKKNTWPRSWARASFLRGVAFFALGDLDDAFPFLKRGLSMIMDLDSPDELLTFLAHTANVVTWQGEHERAAELLALGLTSHHRPMLEIDPLLTRTRAELEETLGEERFAAAWERGKELDPMATAEEVLAALEEMEAAGRLLS